MPRPGPVKRLLTALESLQSPETDGEPLHGVSVARRIREAAEDLEKARVNDARGKGVSWREIGQLYKITKQAAQQRFGGRPRDGHKRSPKARAEDHAK